MSINLEVPPTDTHIGVNLDVNRQLTQPDDIRHEAEAGSQAQSLSFTHIFRVDEPFLPCGVMFGFIISFLLKKTTK